MRWILTRTNTFVCFAMDEFDCVVEELFQYSNDLLTLGHSRSLLPKLELMVTRNHALLQELAKVLPFVATCLGFDYCQSIRTYSGECCVTIVSYYEARRCQRFVATKEWETIIVSVLFLKSFHVTLGLYVRRAADGRFVSAVRNRTCSSQKRIKAAYHHHWSCLRSLTDALRSVQ